MRLVQLLEAFCYFTQIVRVLCRPRHGLGLRISGLLHLDLARVELVGKVELLQLQVVMSRNRVKFIGEEALANVNLPTRLLYLHLSQDLFADSQLVKAHLEPVYGNPAYKPLFGLGSVQVEPAVLL